ncbi:hypothetical protein DSO57_1026096 [Entomophthora muscae]|uniref:Uncharacterized protein n=1 Tax=Entomophthora muscae TaxID=34485 RepID=A0ACC2S3V4_9FUNG|nr:hypothetical protein DSO57_1026096 [Entomophthora muscae]
MKLNNKNTYLVQGLDKHKQDKVLHPNQLRPHKAQKRQCKTALPATKQQLVHYTAWAPNNLPDDLPPDEANLQPGGGVKTAGLPAVEDPEWIRH